MAHVAMLIALLVMLPAAAQVPGVDRAWSWPVEGEPRVVEEYQAPAHEYGPGHRGVDIAAQRDAPVLAPADGVVAFRGVVVDRPLLTIDHGGGIVTTFEPMQSDLAPGAIVHAGDQIGTITEGGHSAPGSLHVGVRLNGVYIDPMLMFGDVPRAILLPCCDAFTLGGGRVGRSL